MDKFQKYAELQKTVWKKWENTTLGNLPAEQFDQIDSEYEKMIAGPSVEGPTDGSNNGGTENGTESRFEGTENGVVADGAEKVGSDESQTPPIDNVDPVPEQRPADADVLRPTSPDVASETGVVGNQSSEMADMGTGFDDDIKAGE